jgi:hypothetical protein
MEQKRPYPWDDGYVFLHGKKSWKGVCGLWADDHVRYAGRLEPDDGPDPDRVIVFVEVYKDEPDAGQKLKDKISEVLKHANPTSSTATSTTVGTYGPTRWSEKLPWGAFLRVTAAEGQSRSVFQSLYPQKDGGQIPDAAYYGHALCDGDWQVLLELGAQSKRDLDPLIAQASSVRGVASVIVNKQKNHITKPERPKKDECKDWVDDNPAM